MAPVRAYLGTRLVAGRSLLRSSRCCREVYPLIVKGKVTMPDGSPPPFSVGIERICSDAQGSAPGPVTDKKGEYLLAYGCGPLADTRVLYSRYARRLHIDQRGCLRA